jgi:ATP-dependent Zn protease
MKFAVAAVASLLFAESGFAFVTQFPLHKHPSTGSKLGMAMEMPPPEPLTAIVQTNDLPVIAANPSGQPSSIRYSDFLKLVNADKIEKVTFSADGSQLLGVDVDGSRLKIDTLPNDPDLLSQLTTHKVCNEIRVIDD